MAYPLFFNWLKVNVNMGANCMSQRLYFRNNLQKFLLRLIHRIIYRRVISSRRQAREYLFFFPTFSSYSRIISTVRAEQLTRKGQRSVLINSG